MQDFILNTRKDSSTVGYSPFKIWILVSAFKHTHYTLKRESLVGTLEAPRGVRQMNGAPQSGAD